MTSLVRRSIPALALGATWSALFDTVGSPLRVATTTDAFQRFAGGLGAGRASSDDVTEILVSVLWVLVLVITFLFVIGAALHLLHFEINGRWRRLAAMALLLTGGVASSPTTILAAPHSSTVQPSDRPIDESGDRWREVAISATSALIGAGAAVTWMKRRRTAERSVTLVSGPTFAAPIEPVDESHLCDLRNTRRVHLAARQLFHHAPQDRVDCLVLSPRGDVTAEFLEPVKPIRYWNARSSRSLVLDGTTTIVDLEQMNGGLEGGEPLMMHVGHRVDSQVWVPLEIGVPFVIEGPDDEVDSVWRTLVNAVMMSPFTDLPLLTSHATSTYLMGDIVETDDRSPSLVTACAPAVLDERSSEDGERANLVVARGMIPEGGRGLRWADGIWTLQPNSSPIVPIGWVDDEIQRIRQILGDGVKTTRHVAPIAGAGSEPSNADRSWTFMVCVLGHPEVRHHSGERVRFAKTKGEELVVWLALHPGQRRRGLARTALWNASVKDATFSNVAFDARRSLVLLEPETRGDDWIPITMRDELPLSDRVTTDVGQLGAALDHARRQPEDDGLAALRAGLELVQGTPFADSDYTWPDQIGLCGDAAVLVVRSALLMADMCKEIGDIDGVHWATSKGLLALPGHEELVAIRMRTHAEFGDFSAVRSEWDSYCRALAADDWGPVQPSPKLIELWKKLCLRTT